MKIGDKVRFLNQTGGGIVVGFGKKGWAIVEDDEEGFEIPVPEKECIVVEENAAASHNKSIQTKDGDKLNIALAYTKAGAGFECSLVNDCNFSLLATYTVCSPQKGNANANGYCTLFASEILPYQRKELFKLGREDLNDFSKKVLFRAIPYKKVTGAKTSSMLKPVIEKEFVLDPMNLLKDGMYRENDYTPEKAYIIVIANENVQGLPLLENNEEEKLKKALKEKFEAEPANRKSNGGKAFVNGKWIDIASGNKESIEDKALIKTSSSGILEVDLHASALLETTAGMDNSAILKYQTDKFNEAMNAVIRKKGQRIVFIHGKGDGVLRKAILAQLKSRYPQCKWQDASFKEYGYGATMVTI